MILHCHTLMLDRLSTFLMAFSTFVLKRSFSQNISIHSYSLPQTDLLELSLLVVCQSLAAVVLVSAAN